MSRHTHLDMNQIIQSELQERRKGSSLPRQQNEPTIRISEDTGSLLNAEYGPQQVESLLRYVVDFPLEKAMSDAMDDNDAVRHLRKLKGK
ncbi:MAG: hypothetical protein GF334_04960 [Candidatus Altiarchaeales archaeon]|nr:hypothetical protein [Candidatus Altiarchaeales archaeon]